MIPRFNGFALWISTAVALAACSDSAPTPGAPLPTVATLEMVSGNDQRIWSGRRSVEPLVVLALDPRGDPVPNIKVAFEAEGPGGGALSQPVALTDAAGRAETFLLETAIGSGSVVATAGSGQVEFTFEVVPAPGEILFAEGNGEVGLTGFPHPDSVIQVTVLDTEGNPLVGAEVWFAAQGRLSKYVDTTNASGQVGTILRDTYLGESNGYFWAFIFGFPEVTTYTLRKAEAPAARAVIVSIDGLRADALARYTPPTLSRLASEGAHTTLAQTVEPSLTVPAHLSLLSGVPPTEHGVFQDVIELTAEMVDLDPLFRFARKRGRNAVAFMAQEGPLEGFEIALACKLAFGLDSLELVAPSASIIAEAALPSVVDPTQELVFIHLPDPDIAGHAHGFNSPEYASAVLAADSALGRIIQALEPQRDSVVVIVVSDHGGGGDYGDHLHGSMSDEDRLIPIFIWGGRVAPGADLAEASILDVAPTALWSIGLAPPYQYRGDPLMIGFR